MTNRFGLSSRRQFLKGAAGLSFALPLSFAGNGRAQSTHPKRFVIFFTPNGTVQDKWSPYPDWNIFNSETDETGYPMSPILQPLEAHRDDLLVLEGIHQQSSSDGPGDGHQRGMGHMLTGRPLQEGNLFEGGGNSGSAGWAGGISVDQHIANHIGQDTKFPSLEFGVRVLGSTVWSRMCYAGAGLPIPPENDPNNAFNRIFADVTGDPEQVARLRSRRLSVLDFVLEEFQQLKPKLGAENRSKVEQHFDAVREIETRLLSDAQANESCQPPEATTTLNPTDPANFPEIGRLQMDLLVSSLACDLTRVASIQWTKSVGDIPFTWLGIQEGHHTLSHEPDGNQAAQDKLTQINQWYASQFAYLIQKMKEIPEGDGTLLDNTVILWTNELGVGNSHTRNDMPYVLAGSAGGYFNTGRYLRYGTWLNSGPPHNDLLLTLVNSMGINDTSFGSPQHCDGPIANLLA